MALINRVPQGLLGLLDTKTLGKNPDDLLSTVQPTIDLKALFLANSGLTGTAVIEAGIVAGDIGNVVATVTVPAGELWWVQSVASDVVVGPGGAGAEYGISPVIVTATGFGFHVLQGPRLDTTLAATERRVTTWTPPGDGVLAGPGTVFGTVPLELFVAASPVTTSVLHYSVQV